MTKLDICHNANNKGDNKLAHTPGQRVVQYLQLAYIYEPRFEKTGLQGFRPGPTQTRLHRNRKWLEA